MDFGYGCLPLQNGSKMIIKQRKIKRTITICGPRSIDKRTSRKIKHLAQCVNVGRLDKFDDQTDPDAHALEVVQAVLEPSDIATMAQLGLR